MILLCETEVKAHQCIKLFHFNKLGRTTWEEPHMPLGGRGPIIIIIFLFFYFSSIYLLKV